MTQCPEWEAFCQKHRFRPFERNFLHIEYIFGTGKGCCAHGFWNDNRFGQKVTHFFRKDTLPVQKNYPKNDN